jgi:hypothetical protein
MTVFPSVCCKSTQAVTLAVPWPNAAQIQHSMDGMTSAFFKILFYLGGKLGEEIVHFSESVSAYIAIQQSNNQ